MEDFLFQQLSTVQSNKQPTPRTIVATTTIAPDTFLTFISGTTAIGTITPPVQGAHMLAIVTGTVNNAFTTSGNIAGATTGNTTQPVLLIYNPISGRYLRAIGA